MKVLFLDIDGVLNNSDTFKLNSKIAKETGVRPLDISIDMLKYLKLIIDKTDCKIVLSSMWRLGWNRDAGELSYKLDRLVKLFRQYNLEIMDATGRYSSRGEEIAYWLVCNTNVTSYVILDDEVSDMEEFVANKRVVKIEDGLTLRDANKAIKILNG